MKRILFLLTLISFAAVAQKKNYPFSDGKKFGIISEDRVVILEPQLDVTFQTRKDQSAIVKKDNKYGLVSADGKFIVPAKYDLLDTRGPWGAGVIGNKKHIVDLTNGKQSPPFDDFIDFCYCDQTLFIVQKANKQAVVRGVEAKPVTKFIYDKVDFQATNKNTRVYVTVGAKKGVLDLTTNKLIIPIAYESIWSYDDDNNSFYYSAENGTDVTRFGPDGKEISRSGQERIGTGEVIFEEVVSDANYESGRQAFIYNVGGGNWKITFEKRGYSSTEVLETNNVNGFDNIEKFQGVWYDPTGPQYFKATKGGKVGVIDHTGKEVVPFTFDSIEPNRNDYFNTKEGQLYGLLNRQFAEIKKPTFKFAPGVVNYHYEAFFITMPDGREGYMTKAGKILLPGMVD